MVIFYTILTSTEVSLSDQQSHVSWQWFAEVGDEVGHLSALAEGGAKAVFAGGEVT